MAKSFSSFITNHFDIDGSGVYHDFKLVIRNVHSY